MVPYVVGAVVSVTVIACTVCVSCVYAVRMLVWGPVDVWLR